MSCNYSRFCGIFIEKNISQLQFTVNGFHVRVLLMYGDGVKIFAVIVKLVIAVVRFLHLLCSGAVVVASGDGLCSRYDVSRLVKCRCLV